MTTFQDPPPQSRRSARQSERDEVPETPADFAPTIEPASVDAPSVTPEAETGPTAPTGATAPPSGDEPLTRSARRAREAAQQGLHDVPRAPGGEPLEYMTQGRDEPLSYQAPEPQLPPAPRQEAQAPAQPGPEPAAQPATEPGTPQFRVRDFSPEGRATGRRAAPPPLIEPGSAPAGPPSDLEYRTEVGPASVDIPAAEAVVPSAPPVPYVTEPFATGPFATGSVVEPSLVESPVAESPIVQSPPAASYMPSALDTAPQQTLTRRELRQRMEEESAASSPAPSVAESSFTPRVESPVDPSLVTASQPPVDPALVTGSQPPLDPALVTGSQPPLDPALMTGSQPPLNPSLVTGSQPPPPVASSLVTGAQNPTLVSAPQPSVHQAAPPPPPASAAPASQPPAPPLQGFEALSGQLAPPSASQRVPDQNDIFAPPVSVTPSFVEPVLDPVDENTGSWVAPVGHWSRQADLDDETQPWENTVTREVGGGNVATTTSALVLPEMPRANPFPAALNGTGEILLTGSIDLPRSLSNGSGDSRHFDNGDVDLLYDEKERDLSGTDSSPVSAIRAVSTHTSARGVISSANKPHGNRMLTVLLVTAAVMAVGVVGLLIAGLAGQIF